MVVGLATPSEALVDIGHHKENWKRVQVVFLGGISTDAMNNFAV